MEKITPDYIVGLVDGEGSFTVYVKDPDSQKQVKRRTKVEPRFYVKFIEKDKKILYDLKEFFGCGNVYFQKDTRPNHQHCYRYEVANRYDLGTIIIPFFRKNSLRLQSKKGDFEVFCRIFEMIMKNDHLKTSGLRRIFALKQKMH
ncbi:MAG: LAGLIDADG family homing endonuclease [Candidatus Moranbacteria bacterium]|nr:LAGLIDADG family homing endonuclease [Candidatus Moranbacteria bacterium]